ncbi:MAG: GldG family protein [Treponema sp.]|jgi:ABC-type uncharacterized transport system involved in gliding motility auxiliary subunit|nr:GldG family protein [Treponema sp.]
MNRNQARIIALLSAAIILLLFLLSGRLWFRLDLTRNKAYTISEVSKNLYRKIADQVTVTYFVSERLSRAHPMPGEIGDLLREYAAHSRGKIRFIQKDPSDAEVAGGLEGIGIAPQQIQLVEKNEVTVATVYSGILIEYLDRESVIPVVFSLDTLEYDISSRIRAMVRNVDREIGVIVGDAHKQWSTEYRFLYSEFILSGFRVRLINPGEEIPADLPTLFVLGGAGDLDEYSQYLIDRYIVGGGNVFFALDGVLVDMNTLEARAVQDKGLLTMLANYGVVLRPALVLDATPLTMRFQTQSGYTTYIQTIRYPQWLGVREDGGNPDQPLTARFDGLDLYWASPLELYPPPGVDGEILFTTSDEAWLQDQWLIASPMYLQYFAEEADETWGTKILGASLSGIFPSAFEGRPRPLREGETSPEGAVSLEGAASLEGEVSGEVLFSGGALYDPPVVKKPARIIVVGDTDFAGDLMQTNRGEDRNLGFLIRVADWLSNDEDMVAIRGRVGLAGRLDRIVDEEKRDMVMALSRTINTIVIPLGVIAAGFFFVLKRKTKTAKAATPMEALPSSKDAPSVEGEDSGVGV